MSGAGRKVYPPSDPLDLSKLPALDLSKPKAMMALQQAGLTGALMVKYLAEWDKCKRLGGVPTDRPPPEPSTRDMSLQQILEEKGGMDLARRSVVYIEGVSGTVEKTVVGADGEEETIDVHIEHLASMVIKLDTAAC